MNIDFATKADIDKVEADIIATQADIAEIKEAISSLMFLVKKLAKDTKSSDVITIADICSIKGISRTQLTLREQYLMPNNGMSDYPDGIKRWNISTFEAWEKIPISQRKEAWEQSLRRRK